MHRPFPPYVGDAANRQNSQMMSTSWQPSDEQMNIEIAPAYEEIRDRIRKLQAVTGCPDTYITVLLEFIAADYCS